MSTQYQKLLMQIEDLKQKAEEVKRQEKMEGIAEVKSLMSSRGVTLADLGARNARKAKTTSPVAPKYRDPATGSTWTGRGRSPVWLSNYVEAGRSRDEFLIK